MKTPEMSGQKRLEYQQFVKLLRIPPPISNRKTCFAFSLHKAGSTLMFNMLQDIAPYTGLTYFSIEDRTYALGYSPNELPRNVADVFQPNGYLYGGFRYLEGYDSPLVRACSKVLLVRNPLDILTSLYFAMTRSHVSPGARGTLLKHFRKRRELASTMSVDDFAKRLSKWLFSRFMTYRSILGDSNLAVFRYEDIIYNKRVFLTRLCEHYGWNIPEYLLEATAAKHDQIPDIERPEQHLRQVHPGNHRKHLASDTIDQLTAEFEPILKAFRYASCESPPHVVLRDVVVPKWKPFLPTTG